MGINRWRVYAWTEKMFVQILTIILWNMSVLFTRDRSIFMYTIWVIDFFFTINFTRNYAEGAHSSVCVGLWVCAWLKILTVTRTQQCTLTWYIYTHTHETNIDWGIKVIRICLAVLACSIVHLTIGVKFNTARNRIRTFSLPLYHAVKLYIRFTYNCFKFHRGVCVFSVII